MRRTIPMRAAVRVSETVYSPPPGVLRTVLAIWSAVALLIVAGTVAILWDLKS